MKRSIFLITSATALGLSTPALADRTLSKVQDKTQQAKVLFVKMAAGDERLSIPTALLERTNCVVIIPDAYRAAFMVGGSGGWGVAACRRANGWSAPAYINLGSLSGGFQAGFEKMDIVLLFTRNDTLRKLSQSGFQTNFDSAIYAYVHSKGLFLGVNIQGSVLDPNDTYNRLIYGNLSAYDILNSDVPLQFVTGRTFTNALELYAPAAQQTPSKVQLIKLE